MDNRGRRQFLDYYERELAHIRESAHEFAKEFPKIAQRLSLEQFDCNDPYVERLIESFAYLAARVQLKLDAEFPRFTNSLLESVCPHYLAPTPSMAVVQIMPDLEDAGLAPGFPIPRGASMRSQIARNEQTACEYRTSQEVTLLPIAISEVSYHTRDVETLSLPRTGIRRAAIRIKLRATAGLSFKEISLDRLTIFLRGSGDVPARIYEALLAHAEGVITRPAARPVQWQERAGKEHVRRVGFDPKDAMLRFGPRSFHGYRMLHEYFSFPQRFLFVELSGLQTGVRRNGTNEMEIIVPLKAEDPKLEKIDLNNIALFATPVINLFPKKLDRIHVSDRFHEFHVVPDRTRPLDFEVYQIERVTGYGAGFEDLTEFKPFYSATDLDADNDAPAYFAIHRQPRKLSERERQGGRRSSYGGSEAYVSLVDAKAAPYRGDLRQLGVEALCTNRDLPLRMPIGVGQTDFQLDVGVAIESTRVLAGPTPPRPSFAQGETAWRLVSHLGLNYLSLADSDESQGAAALRDLLTLYVDPTDAAMMKQIAGVRSIAAQPITRRVHASGPVSFARGSEVTLRMEEQPFEGLGIFVLGSVLDAFFTQYVSINSFTETVIVSNERGEVMRWPATIGKRHTI
ncbi:MAG: type VI secretion system baseplate subunit TssF [Phycisphaeraceae bacterium]|nr:type VI secretion system baseplate subunit TssF [Phycisphaeraceae bacterium]